MAEVTKKITLKYSEDNVDEPMVYTLITKYNILANITKAKVYPDKEGYLVMNVTGEEESLRQGIDYLKSKCMEVVPFADTVKWDKDNCTQCGACTAVCPSGALGLNRPEMTIKVQEDKCILCNMCVLACPVMAVSLAL